LKAPDVDAYDVVTFDEWLDGKPPKTVVVKK
jgi:hypothetical protein